MPVRLTRPLTGCCRLRWRGGLPTISPPWGWRLSAMSEAKPALVSLGKYQIRGVLGRGAMGTVYDGWDPVIGRRVAIKTVRLLGDADPEVQEGLERFKREAQAAGRLSHPNIVGVYDYGETDETAYIVMEFVEGPSLKDLLDAR